MEASTWTHNVIPGQQVSWFRENKRKNRQGDFQSGDRRS
jgi:hypothetical protein